MSWNYDPESELFTRQPAPYMPEPTTAYAILGLTDAQLRQRIAVHEAGHAILMLNRGIPFGSIHIADDLGHDPDNDGPAAYVKVPQQPLAVAPLDALLAVAAGERAEDRWLREQGLWTSARAWVAEILARHDRQQIARMAQETCGRPVTYGVGNDPQWDLSALHEAVDEALDGLWGRVLSLAGALNRHGTLSYVQAAAAAGYAPALGR